jgi:hypothetical protein
MERLIEGMEVVTAPVREMLARSRALTQPIIDRMEAVTKPLTDHLRAVKLPFVEEK